MTNTPTLDTQATVEQVIRLVEAGSELVRITAANRREAENLARIKAALRQRGITIPLIADIHFQPEAAEIAAQIVEKVRINPGNYAGSHHQNKKYTEQQYRDELGQAEEKLLPLLEICKRHETALRIGINHGSLSDRILFRYGNTPEGMVAAAMEFTEICHQAAFEKLVISLKASHVPTMIAANKLLIERFQEADYHDIIHLGVTEAGNGEEARIKSAAGIGSLLAAGIGDTLRVSLTEAPEREIPFAKKLVTIYGRGHQTYTDPLSAGHQILKLSYDNLPQEELMIRAAADAAGHLSYHHIKDIRLENGTASTPDRLEELSLEILQALGIRYSKTEFVACPSCGRTLFDIESVLEKVKARLGDRQGLKIAVMGCIVNGPGEIADADFGLMGAGSGKVTVYKGSEPVLKNLTLDEAVLRLEQLIDPGSSSRESEKFS